MEIGRPSRSPGCRAGGEARGGREEAGESGPRRLWPWRPGAAHPRVARGPWLAKHLDVRCPRGSCSSRLRRCWRGPCFPCWGEDPGLSVSASLGSSPGRGAAGARSQQVAASSPGPLPPSDTCAMQRARGGALHVYTGGRVVPRRGRRRPSPEEMQLVAALTGNGCPPVTCPAA